jgi:hypothetical protein
MRPSPTLALLVADRPDVAALVGRAGLGSGSIVASEIEVTNMLANLV